MSFTLTREFFIPRAELNAVKREEGASVTYTWELAGKFLAKGFSGKTNKPTFYHAFNTAEKRDAFVTKFFADRKDFADRKAALTAQRKAHKATFDAKVDLPEGEILIQSWGWEQTNVDFFKVVGHFGKLGVLLVKVGSKRSDKQSSGNGMADYCEANLDHVGTEVIKARQDGKSSVAISGCEKYSWGSSASIWDGTPHYRSWYA